MVEDFIHLSSLAHVVQAMMLDSPVLNWRATLTYQAQKRSVPTFLAIPSEWVSSIRTGINFDDLDQINQPQSTICCAPCASAYFTAASRSCHSLSPR